MIKKKEETDSLAHTRWNCKYHIVFAPKYRRQAIYGQIKADIGSISMAIGNSGVKDIMWTQ